MKKFFFSQLNRYYLFSFLKNASFFSAVLIPFFTEWGGVTLFHAQLLQSWFSLWIFIMEVPTGAIADYFGRKWSMGLGALVAMLAVLIYGSFPSFAVFLLGEFLFATAFALISGADEAWVYDHLVSIGKKDQSTKVFGKAQSFHLLGMLISASIGGLIAKNISLNAPMLLSAIPMFLTALVGFSLKEPKFKQKVSESTRYIQVIKQGFSYLKNHRLLKLMSLDMVIVSATAYFVIWFYQPLLMKVGVSILYFGFIHAGLLLSEILVSHHFSWFEKRLTISYQKFSALMTIAGFLIVGVYPHVITIGIFILTAGAFGLTRITYMTSKMNKHIPSDMRATTLSSISMFRRFALVVLNPVVGLLATNNLQLAVIVVGLLPVGSLLIKYKKIN